MNALPFTLFVLATAIALSWPLGRYLTWAMDGPHAGGLGAFVDRLGRRTLGAAQLGDQDWRRYAMAMLVANGVAFALAWLALVGQGALPLNPDARPGLAVDLAFHTAASFVTNTNQQHYTGEAQMSHFTQLAVLMWLQFVSAATGMAVLTALARALTGRRGVGNFYQDVLRAALLVLLPMALLLALPLALAGVPMTLDGAVAAHTLEGAVQTIGRGPVAAFVAIKQLGTNGGGFFGTNSAHPLENPTFATNVLQTIAILVLPMACVWMFGRIVGNVRHAAVLFAVMLALLAGKTAFAIATESAPTVAFAELPIAADVGNLEGKELRFGAAAAPLWAVATTCTSNGSVNCMHDSLNPLTGLAPLVGMWLNATFGGVGVGMLNMFLYVVLAAFLAGMMVGRTPEYLRRRIGIREVKFAVLALLAHALFVLVGTAVFAATPWGTATVTDRGPHGFTQILYEMTSASANNGSGFEGLGDDTVPWNLVTGIVMLLARYVPIVLPLAIAASLGEKRPTASSAGTLSVTSATFAVMLLATIVCLGALTFLPAASLGPIAEHLLTSH